MKNHIEPHSTTSLSTWHKNNIKSDKCWHAQQNSNPPEPGLTEQLLVDDVMPAAQETLSELLYSSPELPTPSEVWVEGTTLTPKTKSLTGIDPKIKLATTIIFPSHSKSLGSFSDVYIVLPYWNVNLQVWRCRQDSLSIPLSPQSPGSQQPPFLAADPGTKSDLYRYSSH